MAGKFLKGEVSDDLIVDREDNKSDIEDKEWETVDYSCGSGWSPVAGCCQYSSKFSCSLKCREFLYWLVTTNLLRRVS